MTTKNKGWAGLVVVGPTMLALGYLWGIVYSDTYLSALGFGSHQHTLSVQEAYVQAYLAGITVALEPFRWLVQLPTWIIVVVLGVPMLVAGVAGWWWSEAGARQLGTAGAGRIRRWIGPRLRRAISWSLRAGLFVLAPPYAVVLVAALTILSVAAPQWAAKANAEKVWITRSFEKWNRAMWITYEGEERAAFVYACWERECALLDDAGRSFVVPVERVHERSGRILGTE